MGDERADTLADALDEASRDRMQLKDELDTLRSALRLLVRGKLLPDGLVDALVLYDANPSPHAVQLVKLNLFEYALATGDTLRG